MRNLQEFNFEPGQVAKYARKSTANDTADKSIEDQLYICNQTCSDWGLNATAADNYIEKPGHGGDEWWVGFGGTGIEGDGELKGARRPVLTKIVNGIVAGQIKAVVVWRADRLWRKTAICDILIDLFTKYKVALFDKNGFVDLESPEGRTAARNVATASQHQRESAIVDSMRGVQAVKSKGGLVTTPNCLGFRSAGIGTQKARAIPEEIVVINRIFQLYDDGTNINLIAQKIMDDGFSIPEDLQAKMSRKRQAWTKDVIYYQTIQGILSDCRYQGRQKYQGKEWDCPSFLVDGAPAVPTELYERVQRKIQDAKRIPHRVRYRHPLGGLVKCGICGCGLQRKVGSRREDVFYWMPKENGKNHINCMHRIPYVMMDQVDEFIEKHLIPNMLAELAERGQVVDESAIRTRIAELEAQLDLEKKKSSDLMSYFGKISAEAFIEIESTLTKTIDGV